MVDDGGPGRYMPNAIPAMAPPMTSHAAFTRRVASKAPAPAATRHEETLTMLARPSCHVTIRSPVGPVVLDQALQSGRGRMPAEREAESRGVEVGVHIGERWHQNPALPIDGRHV